jgi:hypothetical protein
MWLQSRSDRRIIFRVILPIVDTCWSLEIWQIFYFNWKFDECRFYFQKSFVDVDLSFFFFSQNGENSLPKRKNAATAHYGVEIK